METETAQSGDRSERSRRAILDAALPIFARFGFEGASLNQIIRDSGLTKGGFYFHFPSKQALALAVIEDYQARWMAESLAELSKLPRAVDRLFAWPRMLVKWYARGGGPAMLHQLTEELARDPLLRDQICGNAKDAIDMVAGQFREAQSEGSIRPELDPQVLAEVAVGAFTGMQVLTDQLMDGEFERRVEALIQIVQRATLTESP